MKRLLSLDFFRGLTIAAIPLLADLKTYLPLSIPL